MTDTAIFLFHQFVAGQSYQSLWENHNSEYFF